MTDLSLVPEIARYKKISFIKLIEWMIKDASINRFFNGKRRRMNPVEKGEMIFNSVLIEVDESTKKAKSIIRFDKEFYI